MKIRATIAALACLTHAASAQEINLASLDEEANRVHVTTGAEYSFIASLGYSRILPFLDRKIVVTGEATVPWASLDAGDYGARAGALVPVLDGGRWKVAGTAASVFRGTKTRINQMTDVGVDVGVVGGFYSPRVFVAGEFGVDLALTTRIEHTDGYRMAVHADAQDGWYANPGANLRAGLQAGASFSRYDVILRAGQVRDVDGKPPLFPWYGTLTVDARW